MKQIKIEKVDWDSNTFNIKVGKVIFNYPDIELYPISIDTIKLIISIGQKEKYNLLYLNLPNNQQLAEFINHEAQILLADTKVLYSKTITKNKYYTLNTYVKSYISHHTSEELLNLALESGKYSRFKLDPNFPSDTFKKMYSIWIDKSIRREIADNVLVYQVQENILAMLTYSVFSSKVIIGLIAVKESHRGKNIGSILLSSLENLMGEKIKTIEVATQNRNINACNFYEKNQFSIKEKINIYHIWL